MLTKAGFSLTGSSPLTRGKPWGVSLNTYYQGLIPAHAGKTRRSAFTRSRNRAHPRSRGENQDQTNREATTMGSSPLTRGKLQVGDAGGAGGGLIPAHAGKTHPRRPRARHAGAHPRSRGENADFYSQSERRRGSSPLTRGKLPIRAQPGLVFGLIPAHAGKTLTRPPTTRTPRAHPRSRGENKS